MLNSQFLKYTIPLLFIGLLLTLTLILLPRACLAQLPQDHAYQITLRNHIGTLTEDDFEIELSELIVDEAFFGDIEEVYRSWLVFGYRQNDLPSPDGLRRQANYFTLSEIERDGSVYMKTGRGAWINVEETLFWALWDYPGNPHYDSRAVKMRSFVASAVDMMMEDQLIESGSNRRADFLGGNLIWWAMAYGLAKEELPEEVKAAYESALIKMFERIESWGPQGIHADMDTRALISMQYVAKYVESENLQSRAFAYIDRLLDRHLKAPGYIDHGDTYDADYNGISLYYINWAARINEYQPLVDAIDKMSKLKAYMSLPDPDGIWYSPNHANSSSQKGAANDSWGSYFRDVGLADFSEYSTYLIYSNNNNSNGSNQLGLPSEADMISHMRSNLQLIHSDEHRTHQAFATPSYSEPPQWSHEHWTNSLFNSTALYYREGLYSRLSSRPSNQAQPPFLSDDDFVESFDDKILSVRKNGYGAIIFNDRLSWWTSEGTTQGLNGIGGGNLSAFWTPETGTVILGVVRMPSEGGINFDEWEIWPIHAISGEASGRSFSSAAQRHPTDNYELDHSEAPRVTITGDLANEFSDPDNVLTGEVTYQRQFVMLDEGLRITSSVTELLPDNVESLYEIIPVFRRNVNRQGSNKATSIYFYNNGGWVEATTDEVITDRVQLRRFNGTVNITFDNQQKLKLSSDEFFQRSSGDGQLRNILIDMLESPDDSSTPSVSYTVARGEPYQDGGGDDGGGDDGGGDGEEEPEEAELHLEQNYPNPFNPTTQIQFTVDIAQEVSLNVYNISGRLVSQLFNGRVDAGNETTVTFDANDLASGIYFYKLITTNGIVTRKMTYLK